ncbi:hypothetical protein [Nocardioides pacificus]
MSILRVTLAVTLLAAALAGCSGEGPAGPGDASCASLLEYDGHEYSGFGELRRTPAVTGRVEPGFAPGCDDGNGAAESYDVEVAELADISSDRAVLVNGTVYVRTDLDFPEEIRIWFTSPRCVEDGPFEVDGDWLAVSPSLTTEPAGALRAPYWVELKVSAGPRRYLGTTIRVRVTAATDPGLRNDDARTSLQEGGGLRADVTCREGRFVATGLSSTPG